MHGLLFPPSRGLLCLLFAGSKYGQGCEVTIPSHVARSDAGYDIDRGQLFSGRSL
jgi:hypothetical protein